MEVTDGTSCGREMDLNMDSFDRVFIVRETAQGWVVLDGREGIATTKSQSRAIRCAAMAAMTAQAQGFVATFRLDV